MRRRNGESWWPRATRVDLALLAPAVGLVVGWRFALGALGAWAVDAKPPPLRQLSVTLPANLPLTEFFGPLGTWPGLVRVGLATRRETLPLLFALAPPILSNGERPRHGRRGSVVRTGDKGQA